MIILTIFNVLYIAYQVGKVGGKWGMFIAIWVIFLMGLIKNVYFGIVQGGHLFRQRARHER